MALTKVTGQVIKNTTDVTVGVLTVTNTLAVGGTVSIGGTLTYEDVTNVDAVGLITARDGIVVGSGITLSVDGHSFHTGVITATSFSGETVVGDTSPQLGGNLDVNTKNIVFGDSGGATDDRLTFGASTDLSIYHDGSHSRIDETGTGNLMIQSDNAVYIKKGVSENIAIFNADGAVELYHNNVKKLETNANGIVVTGGIYPQTDDSTDLGSNAGRWQDVFVSDSIDIIDNGEIRVGTGDDLKLYHDGSQSFLVNSTGYLLINSTGGDNILRSSSNVELQPASGESGVKAIANGSVELYHNNLPRLTTNSIGVDVRNETECFFKIARTNDSPSDNDYVGNLEFLGKDSGNNFIGYAKIVTQIVDQTDGTEDGRMMLQSVKDGTMTTAATVEHGIFQRNTAPGYFAESAHWTSAQPNMHNATVKWTSGHYVASTGVFTCPVAGKYLCSASVQAHRANTTSGASSTYFNVLWQKNNSNYHIEMVGTTATNASALGVSDVNGKHGTVTATAIIDCAKDDTLRAHSNHGYRHASQNIVGVILIA